MGQKGEPGGWAWGAWGNRDESGGPLSKRLPSPCLCPSGYPHVPQHLALHLFTCPPLSLFPSLCSPFYTTLFLSSCFPHLSLHLSISGSPLRLDGFLSPLRLSASLTVHLVLSLLSHNSPLPILLLLCSPFLPSLRFCPSLPASMLSQAGPGRAQPCRCHLCLCVRLHHPLCNYMPARLRSASLHPLCSCIPPSLPASSYLLALPPASRPAPCPAPPPLRKG